MAADGSPRRRASAGADVEALLREVLTGQATTDARLEDLSARLMTTQEDAREARDLGNRISTILEEQNIITRLGEHKAEVRQHVADSRREFVAAMAEIRQDFVAANLKLRNDLETALARLKALEDDMQRREGVKSLATWLMKNAPWLLAGIAAFAAGVGLQDKIPK